MKRTLKEYKKPEVIPFNLTLYQQLSVIYDYYPNSEVQATLSCVPDEIIRYIGYKLEISDCKNFMLTSKRNLSLIIDILRYNHLLPFYIGIKAHILKVYGVMLSY